MAARPKTNMVTTTASFDRDTYKRLQILAIERETKVRNLIRKAVDQYLGSLKTRSKKP